MRPNIQTTAGFSLIEALVASLLVASAVVGLAHLVAIGAEQSLMSRGAASALSIAQSKLEQLRGVRWTYAQDGSRVSSPLLAPSPPGSLDADTQGYVDFVDAFGEAVSAQGPVTADFSRRWAIAFFDHTDADTLLLRVCVFRLRGPDRRGSTPAACASAVHTRKP